MAIAFRAAGTSTTGTTALTSMPQPAGTATGDVLVAFVVDHSTSSSQSTAPTGWTGKGIAANAAGRRFQVFTAVVGQNSLSGTSWTFSGLTSRALGIILGYSRGSTDFANQPDVAASTRDNAAGTTGTTSITPGNNGDMVIAGFCDYANGSTWSAEAVATAPTLTERADNPNGGFCSLAIADGVLATAAATGASSATDSSSANNAGILLSLKPPLTVPSVSTQAPTSVTGITATLNGTIVDTGDDSTCRQEGFVWDTVSHADPGNVAPGSSGYANQTAFSGGTYPTGTYGANISALSASTTYFVRFAAQNDAGYAYGPEISFNTPDGILLRGDNSSSSSGTSVTVGLPANTQTGDVLVCFIVDHATSGSSTAPTGWTNMGSVASADGRFQVFTAVRGQNGLSGTSWSFTGLTSHILADNLGYTGASPDFANQPDVAVSARNNAAGTTGTLAITPGHHDDLVIAAFCDYVDSTSWSSMQVATGPTLIDQNSLGFSGFCSIGWADGILGVPADTGDSSGTDSGSNANGALLLALKPLITQGENMVSTEYGQSQPVLEKKYEVVAY